ncbi:MAG: aromatic amino acid exporter YddG [Shimia sp.]
MTRRRATGIGAVAIALWSLLAWFTAESGDVPPFQLLAMTFGIATGAVGAVLWRRPEGRAALRQPVGVWALGVGGLFGYHLLYFVALRNAPVAEASLIAYLWPLLIVLFSALLPGERLRGTHIVGAALGLAGAGLLVTGGRGLALDPSHAAGYAAALGCALTWSGYSVLSRRVAAVPSEIVAGFCAAVALLALACHLALEPTVPPRGGAWLAILGLGLGPVGLAFLAWDVGVKRGDIQLLGTAAYAAPILSTLVLVAVGRADPTWTLGAACLLVTAGAAVAAS